MTTQRIALIPAYEPDERLIGLLDNLDACGIQTIVVDDGSGRAFLPVFRKAGEIATVLRHKENLGKGSALKTGFAFILEKYGEECVVVTMDCDGQHSIKDALRLCGCAGENRGTLVLGSRGLKDGTPLRSRFGNTTTRLVYALVTGHKIHDTQTGLRAFSGSLLGWLLRVQGDRFEYEMNVLLECPRRAIPVKEVEIETIYLNNNSSSHFDTFRDSFLVYREILRFCTSSFAGFLTDYILYSLFLLLGGSLIASNVGARIISACVNYNINRKFVFKNDSRIFISALQYALLAAAILAGNTLLLHILADKAGINRWIAKLLTEFFFFFVSWSVQRFFIFRRQDKISAANAAGGANNASGAASGASSPAGRLAGANNAATRKEAGNRD